jgi:glutamyl-tRNA synthetase
MDFKKLADLLFPDVTDTPEDVEKRFPARELPEGAKVTRLAPSPTGFLHFGTLFPALVDERLAHTSGGICYLRIEDTDAKREVEGAEKDLVDTLAYYGLCFDEGVNGEGETGAYGPYHQSERASIYHVFAKKLVEEGKAYPCFNTEEELAALNAVDKKTEIKTRDWTGEAEARKAAQDAQRAITLEEVESRIASGDPFVLRILASGDGVRKIAANDLIRGKLEMDENDEDFVLLKSDGIPTYHFAHAVDDHLMGTTHVVRGEEWLPSLPKHIQLFRYLGFKAPKYLHIAQLMKMDGDSKKKLSKRDRGAALSDYRVEGYPPKTVMEYVMTLLNSNFEDWRRANPDASWRDFEFSVKKMSVSGCLFDLDKLADVSKNVISRMSASEVYDGALEWAKAQDAEFAALLSRDRAYAESIFAIGRGGKKPRKDLTVWRDVPAYAGFFYDELFKIEDEYPDDFEKTDIADVLADYLAAYDHSADRDAWFDGVKACASRCGFCPDMKEYKQNPDAFKGSVADVSMFIRVAVTGKMNSPDLYDVMHILGEERSRARISDMIAGLR